MKTYENLSITNPEKAICIISHIHPDADALASMVVFKEFLMNHFKCKLVDLFAECDQPPENCLEILDDEVLNLQPTTYDTVFAFDSPNSERLGIYKSIFDSAPNKIVIDHHATNQFFGDINFVEMSSSTCEIIYKILKYFNYEISVENQGKLYAGIITDTNNFSVGNISQETHLIVSEIIDNINQNEIYKHFLQNTSLKQMEMLSLAIQNLKSYDNSQILISNISKDIAKQTNATFEDFSTIVNELIKISNSKLICFIYPKGDSYYVSLRAKSEYDVSQIAVKFNGGGHVGAAAFLSNNDNLSQIENDILNEFKTQLYNNKSPKNKVFKKIRC